MAVAIFGSILTKGLNPNETFCVANTDSANEELYIYCERMVTKISGNWLVT